MKRRVPRPGMSEFHGGYGFGRCTVLLGKYPGENLGYLPARSTKPMSGWEQVFGQH